LADCGADSFAAYATPLIECAIADAVKTGLQDG